MNAVSNAAISSLSTDALALIRDLEFVAGVLAGRAGDVQSLGSVQRLGERITERIQLCRQSLDRIHTELGTHS
jgi:hypothetical protein